MNARNFRPSVKLAALAFGTVLLASCASEEAADDEAVEAAPVVDEVVEEPVVSDGMDDASETPADGTEEGEDIRGGGERVIGGG